VTCSRVETSGRELSVDATSIVRLSPGRMTSRLDVVARRRVRRESNELVRSTARSASRSSRRFLSRLPSTP